MVCILLFCSKTNLKLALFTGDILVILPGYEQLVKLNFCILRQKLLGNIPQQTSIFMLHNNVDKIHLDEIADSNQNAVKIILSTDIAESIYLPSVAYVIDSARRYHTVYNNVTKSKDICHEWSSLECLNRRTQLIGK